MKVKCMLLVGLLGIGLTGWSHPLHLSFTNLEYKRALSRWELTVKIFSDDFESAISLNHDRMPASLKQLKGWLGKQLVIEFDDRSVSSDQWNLKEWKTRDDATWITFTFTTALPIQQVKVENSLLLDLYADQKNLFIFTMGPFQSSHELTGKKRIALILLTK
ncbi:MAG: DUF6702 family protein [Bacteroidota bacterium]